MAPDRDASPSPRLCEARLRANPSLRLVQFDRLEGAERAIFAELADSRDLFGVLIPPAGSPLLPKSLTHHAALFFLALGEPARVPTLAAALFGDEADRELLPYVASGVFEVEHDGAFVSGSTALALFGQTPRVTPAATRLAELSREAIAYGAALEGLGVAELAARLYLFNRAPCPRGLRARFADDSALLSFAAPSNDVAALLGSRWRRQTANEGWIVWHTAGETAPAPYKLYVSPTLEALPRAFAPTVEALARAGCSSFKLGRTAFGVARPDKLVAYFERLEPLHEAVEHLRPRLTGVGAQGVPFTAAIDDDGLLSWGMDPPRLRGLLAGQERQSWRQWVVERVAVSIAGARAERTVDVTGFVLDRLAIDGVDPSSWTPSLSIFHDEAAVDGAR